MTIIGMAGRGEAAEIDAFISERGVEGFEHVVDLDGSIWREFGVSAQPAFVFVNDDGALGLHYGAMGIDDLDEVLTELAAN